MSFKFDFEQAKKDGLVNVYNINLENLPIADDDISCLCQNITAKQIVNVNLIGTKITDKSLESLAKFPNLQYLLAILILQDKDFVILQGIKNYQRYG